MNTKDLKKLQDQIEELNVSNAWKNSRTRKVLITLLSYVGIAGFMAISGFEKPFLGAFIPAFIYFTSSVVLSFFKMKWLKKYTSSDFSLSKKPRGLVAVGTIFSMIVTFPFASSVFIQSQTFNQIYDDIFQIPESEKALILGAAAWGDTPSGILKDRLLSGIDLYNKQKVKKLIMSGAPNEVKVMHQFALDAGVPAEDIINDPKGLRTSASVRHLKKGEKITVVTQAYHLPRAIFSANQFGVDAIGFIADIGKYPQINEFKQREIWSKSVAVLEFFFLLKN